MELRSCLLLALLWQLTPISCTSTVEFFGSKDCGTSIGKVNGTTDGVCHEALANNDGARLIELDQGCAATIYTDPFCSDSATIAPLNVCMSGNLIVGSFSIDCQLTQSSAAAFTANGPTPTASAQSAFSTTANSTATPSGPSIPQAAIIAAVVGASVIAVSLLPICYFARRRYKKNKAAGNAVAELKAKHVSDPMELAATEKAELQQPGDCRPSIPHLAIPNSSLCRRSMYEPMVSPLTPAPFIAQARYERQQQLAPGWVPRSPVGNGTSPTTPERQWYHDKTLPAVPGPQRPGSVAELGTSEPDPRRSPSEASIRSNRYATPGTSPRSNRAVRGADFF